MKLQIIAILLAGLFIFGCTETIYGDELAGNWEASAMGFTQRLYFDGQGNAMVQSNFGSESFGYNILNDEQIELIASSGKKSVVDYKLMGTNILVFQGISYSKVG
jgi:hypothetical protein